MQHIYLQKIIIIFLEGYSNYQNPSLLVRLYPSQPLAARPVPHFSKCGHWLDVSVQRSFIGRSRHN